MTKKARENGVASMDKNPNDNDVGIQDVVASITRDLKRGLSMGNKHARQVAIHALQKRTELKVKCEFGGEKRVTSVSRPVEFGQLCQRLQEMYQMPLNVFYTQCNGEVSWGHVHSSNSKHPLARGLTRALVSRM
ncbi:uncharacterized protein LOC101863440 [Aplysia californica]|uniref:Uncharacterized protein LOC101863440 n=1 Tax=Aplysia californica TaxID=6500 RepID=A0ABM1A178_APLCA|nr:uncharacterized protein LOC101863440 [Aplysia californica]XP_012938753.1 uncharacterized protein LOC101863440 [Aplysia californica]